VLNCIDKQVYYMYYIYTVYNTYTDMH